MGRDHVVLPLYSTRAGTKYVPERSGLNQWLAAGRKRRFGECYFPIPRQVHHLAKDFFPPRGNSFGLVLPGDFMSSATLCQSDSKALMTSPNHHLGMWLFRLIDKEPSDLLERLNRQVPYTYPDLESIGFDSVKVSRIDEDYTLSPLSLGGYELWVNACLRHSSRD